jgi:hypothetical protein
MPVPPSQLPKLSKPKVLRDIQDPVNIAKLPTKDLSVEEKKRVAARTTRLTKPAGTTAPVPTRIVKRLVNKP